MPMCKMGCDQLFESGYISVLNGQVVNLRKKPFTQALDKYISDVAGNDCPFYSENTLEFFKWHHWFHTKGKPKALGNNRH